MARIALLLKLVPFVHRPMHSTARSALATRPRVAAIHAMILPWALRRERPSHLHRPIGRFMHNDKCVLNNANGVKLAFGHDVRQSYDRVKLIKCMHGNGTLPCR